MEITRLFDLLPHYAGNFNKPDVFAGKEDGVWVKYSTKTYIETSNYISYGFLKLGVQKGDKIATITYNRPEWNFIDMGIQQLGAINVPIYPTISESDYKYILKHAEVKFVFVAGEDLFKKIEHILPEIPSIQAIYTFKNLHGQKHLNELIELGKSNPAPEDLEVRKDSVKPEDIATTIYTSGTTGDPKGVMLTHHNLISNFLTVAPIPRLGAESKALSYLPLCHVYERMLNYMYQYLGISVYYSENLAAIMENINEAHPQILTTVPRLLEKIYHRISTKGHQLKGIKKMIFFWAMDLGFKFEIDNSNGWWYKLRLKIARKLVFEKWHQALGGNLKVIVSGGAALQPRLSRIFWAAGFSVLEGYGLTETSPVITVCTFEKHGVQFGKVGPVLDGVQLKIAKDGEILCKGPNVMKGYYKDEKLTNETIIDGWFHKIGRAHV